MFTSEFISDANVVCFIDTEPYCSCDHCSFITTKDQTPPHLRPGKRNGLTTDLPF